MAHNEEPGDVAEADPGLLAGLSRLTGWVTHEINNPLGGIQNAFALIRDAVPETHPHYKYVASIDREIARIAGLTRRVQQVYGTDGRRQGNVSLRRAVADAIDATEPLRSARRVEVRADIAVPAAEARLASEAAASAIRHLVQHGIEDARTETSIRIRGWQDGAHVWIAVPNRLWDANEVRGPVAGPPGLALQLVRQLVLSLGGEIAITSDNGGTGEVRIGLPIPHGGEAAE